MTTAPRSLPKVNHMAAPMNLVKTLARAAAALAALLLAAQAGRAGAQVALNGAWTQIGTPGTATSYAATFAKPATGANRIILVAAFMELSTAATAASATATYGTTNPQTATGWTRTYVPGATATRQHLWFGYFTEAQIGLASGTMTLTVSGLPTNQASAVYAAVFNNVLQSAPIGAALENGLEANTTPYSFGTTLAYPANGLVVAGFNWRYGTVGSTTPPSGFTEQFDITVSARDQFELSQVSRVSAGTEPATTAATLTSGTLNRWGIGALALSPAATGTVTLATGTDPTGTTLAPGAAATAVDAFTLQVTTGTTDNVGSVTVNLSGAGNAAGLASLSIQNSATCAQATPFGTIPTIVDGANAITLTTPIPATTTATSYYVCATPKTHATMAAPAGAAYTISANVSTFAPASYAAAGSDTAPATAFTIDNLSPGDVTGLTVTPGNGQLVVSWTNPATDFARTLVIYRATTPIADVPVEGTTSYAAPGTLGASTIAFVGGTAGAAGTTTITGLTNGTTYNVKVFVQDGAGNWSTPGAAGTGSPTAPPGAPGTPTYTAPFTTSITVNWTAAAGATTYNVDVSTDGTTFTSVITGLVVLTRTHTLRTANTRYWYRITAVNAGGSTVGTSSSTWTLTNPVVAAPTMGAVTTSSIVVNWVAPTPAATDYLVEWSLTSGFVAVAGSTTATTPTATATGLTSGTGYFFRVTARNGAGVAAARSAVNATAFATTSGPTLTVGNGTDAGLGGAVGPGGLATMVDAFTLQTSAGTDTVTAASVTLSTVSGVGLVELTNDAGTTVYGSAANPASSSVAIPLSTSITATTTLTPYKVRVTPRSHAAMPAVPGGAYAVTASVTGLTSGNGKSYSDTTSGTLTIDNASPTDVSGLSLTPGNGQLVVNWTNPATDYARTLVLYRATTAISDVPVEGTTTYAAPGTLGASTIAFVGGTAGAAGTTTITGLTNGTTYNVKVFVQDAVGNWSTPGAATSGAPVPPVTGLAVGDGTNPGNVALLCPAGAATPLDAFTLSATVAADVVTRISVQLAPAGAWVNVAKVEILDASNAVLGSAVPGGDTVNVYVGSVAQAIGVTSTYTVRITPNTHAAMPAPSAGQQYAVTGTVTSVASNNPRSYGDSASATVTIDNLAPGEVAWSGVATGATNIQLNWSAAADVVVLRKQGGPVTETPVDGTPYAANAILGGSTVACSGSMLLCNSTGLTATTAYYFKVFTRDTCGNYSLGSPVGPLFPGGLNEGNPTGGTLVPVVAILNPMNAAVVTNTAAGFRVQVRAFSRMNGGASQPISAVRLKVASSASLFGATCDVTNYPLLLTLSPRYPSSSAAATDNHGIYETTVGTTQLGASSGAFTLRACAVSTGGTVFSGLVGVTVNDGNPGSPKGDGHLLVRDNSAQLCTDCHNLPTHSAEAVGNAYGSWHADCRDCHTPHSTTNVELIRKQITPPGYNGVLPPRTVIFSDRTTGFSATGGAANVGAAAYANGDGTGVCQVCHTRTSYYLSNGTLTTHNPTQACTTCHAHDKGLKASCTACHGDKTGTYAAIALSDTNAAAAPPTAADKLTTTGVKVGAHQKHVNGNGTVATYRTAPLACASCHPSPNTHNGTSDAAWSVLATNTIINGVATMVAPTPAAGLNAYTTTWEATPTCTNACHGANLPSNAAKPLATWTGGALTCASCHGQSAAAPQPALSATPNQTHPQNTACALCHGAGYAVAAVNKATHIDGTLTRTTAGCTACHGDLSVAGVTLAANLAAAAPGQTGGVNSMDTTGATATTAPGVGAHVHHLSTTIYRGPVACTECHALPISDTDTTHATGVSTSGSRATLTWGTLARGVGASFNNEVVAPTYTGSTSGAYGAAAGSCASTYCHGQFKNGAKATIAWNAPGITCNGCHGRSAGATASEPVGSHPFPAAACGSCHTGYTSTTVNLATHVNGALDVIPMTCTSCHGDAARVAAGTATELDPLGTARLVLSSPPKDTAGLLTGSNQVGAHLQHVNQGATAPALSSALRCANCHTVPAAALHSSGSVDMAWGNVAVAGGATPSYTAASHTCSSTYCHGSFSGGLGANPIAWGNGTLVKLACNGCHGQSVAAPQPTYPHPQNTTCASCHTGYSSGAVVAATHVDGLVTKSTGGCTACHGERADLLVTLTTNTLKAAPGATGTATSADTTGATATSTLGVGAHEAHLVGNGAGNTPRWRSTPIACIECHALPSSDTDTSHATGTGTSTARATIAWGNLAAATTFETKTAAYAQPTCSSTYCHNPKNGDTAATPVVQVKAPAWNGVTAQAQCGSCHGLPPSGTSHPANALCGSCHPGYTATAPTAASAIAAVNALSHINGNLDGGESSGATPCLNCHKDDAATGALYSQMVGGTGVYHHVMSAETGTFQTYPVTSAGKACLNCHADHDVFKQGAPNNTIGRGANLRTSITVAPTLTANFTNTDFSGTAGICLSCHATSLAKSTTAQKSDGTTATHVVDGNGYLASMHQYTVAGAITSGNSLILANCTKCHSDGPAAGYPQYQGGTNKFALHTNVDRRLLNPMGIAAPADNLEEKSCYRCHSASTDTTPGGGPAKVTTASDWFGAFTTMSGGSTSVFAAMQKGTAGSAGSTSSGSVLYFRNSATADEPMPNAFQLASGTYTGTTAFQSFMMTPGVAGTAQTSFANTTTSATTPRFVRMMQFASPRLATGVTVAAGSAFSITLQHAESIATFNGVVRYALYRWTTADALGTTMLAATSSATELGNGVATTPFTETISFTNTTAATFAVGDRFVLELEVSRPSAVNGTATFYWNGSEQSRLTLPASMNFSIPAVAGSGRHDVAAYSGLHLPNPADEHLQRIAANKHVECTDCHDPHQARRAAPDASIASAASTSNTTLNDTTRAWTTNQWAGYTVFITGTGTGTAAGQVRALVTSNTATQLTFTPGLMNFAATPAALSPPLGSSYRLHLDGRSGLSAAAAIGATTLTPAPALTTGFPVNAYVGGRVRIVEGPGIGQVRTITANTATALTVTPAWTTALTTASRFSITPPPAAMTGATGVDVPTWPATNWTASTFSPVAGSTTALPAANAEWQVCFKCHSSANTALATWSADFTDLALEFSPTNQSYHPVIGALPAVDPGVAGSNQLAATQLINGWTPGSVMSCTDCHGADAVSPAAQGPHGSAVKYMLTGVNRAWPFTTAGATSGTLFNLPTTETGIGTVNGMFCRNCHPRMYTSSTTGSNWMHGQYGGKNNHSADWECVKCHIRVPHGGKVSRLMITTNAPARYKVTGAVPVLDFFAKGTNPTTGYGSANFNDIAGCNQHTSATPTEAW